VTNSPQKNFKSHQETGVLRVYHLEFFGMLIVCIMGMKIQCITNERKLKDELQKFQSNTAQYVDFYSGTKNSLDILSFVVSDNASLVILDDDFTSPHSVHLLESIRKVKKEQKTIFLTSNDSLDLGKQISSLGVQFYAIKPISESELIDSVKSILKLTN